MREQPFYCPSCRNALSRVSRRQDYFCRACHSAVAIVDNAYALVQPDLKASERVVSLEELGMPRHEQDP